MESLRNWVKEAEKSKKAIGHFNFATAEMLRGILAGAKELNAPVVVGLSEGERDFFGVNEAVAMVGAMRAKFQYPIFLNADHTRSFEKAKEAIDAGFDAIVADGSKMPFEENIKYAKSVVDYARKSGRDVLVEGELGFIGESSQVFDALPPGVLVGEEMMTKETEATDFVKRTGVDMFSPSVGNVHGMMREGNNPPISLKKISEIRKAAGVPLVLHGGSGIVENELRAVAGAGISTVHISTEIRMAFKKSLIQGLSENQEEAAPYKYMRGSIKAVSEAVKVKLQIFGW